MTDPRERALLWLAAMDPPTAHVRALTLLEHAATRGERVIALRVAGLAAKELGRLDEGIAHLDRALGLAAGYAAAQVRMNLVGLLTARGDVASALAQAARARDVLRGPDADRLAANTACALARAGRLDEAHEVAVRALPRLRRGHDPAALNGLLSNLGLARALRGDHAGAEEALAEAVAVGEAAGLHHQTAMARGNLAFVVARRGDVPRALRLHAEAEAVLGGERLAQCRFDRAETLIAAGLPGEARPVLRRALDEVAAHGYGCDVADGLLLLAHAELADGEPARAAATAERARAAFAAQDRAGWVPLCEHVRLKARWAAGERSADLLAAATAAAGRLAAHGRPDAAAEARIIAARVALETGRPAGHLLASVRRDSGPAATRIASWHALALERAVAGDGRGAVAAVRAGLRVTEEHAEALGALDLRARAAGLAGELAALGLGLARSPLELLAVEEHRRAVLRPTAVRPPADPERAAALTALRVLSGRDGPPLLAADIARLEERVTARTRLRPGRPSRRPLRAAELLAALDGRALIELISVGASLHAVTLAGGRMRRHELGPAAPAVRAIATLRFALRALAARDDRQAAAGLAHSAAHLDGMLLGPLARDIGDRDLVIAPTGPLHGLPWAVLPSLAGRPFTLTPSAAAWLHARAARPPAGEAVLVAGPGLHHADREIAALRALYPAARVLDGAAARAETVRDALDGASVAHIAAHGEFHRGNALFSRLHLADGPLMVHDLEAVTRPPELIVLSACDTGRADEGDALLGMAGVLLSLGTATVIASVTPVRDAATPAFMTAFHTALRRGESPARALAAAPHSHGVAGFAPFGAG
ncbi:CHAT domain-containing protein [Spirillospora albida]|uniref:CHAT domain-containing protein n=1 Tax=Spirillospora albida TaxID=58123 RepID=UPI000AEF8E55|nr:CHAT domain-containing protein [Spirillospora albida]